MSLNSGGQRLQQRIGFAKQRGGFAVGLIVGLLIGLALALGVALYIAKVPSPFHDKVPHRTPEQEAAEAEKLKSWDPNAGLGGKPVARPTGPATNIPAPATAGTPTPAAPAVTTPAAPPTAAQAASPAKSGRDAAAILAGEAAPGPKIPKPAGDPFLYFVQVGAFSNADDAEQQRAKLALQGFGAKISEREQGGRTIHRVRLGPYDNQADASAQQERLKSSGIDAALVRAERN
jgi:cell division protein FtsN